MKRRHAAGLLLAATISLSCLGAALAAYSPGEPPRETVHKQFRHPIANLPGKSLISVVVEYPPGAKSHPHRHAPSAFIYAYVLSGHIRSQVDDAPARVYAAGEDWFETPGAHHVISENASTTERARLLAIFVVADGEPLTTPDHD